MAEVILENISKWYDEADKKRGSNTTNWHTYCVLISQIPQPMRPNQQQIRGHPSLITVRFVTESKLLCRQQSGRYLNNNCRNGPNHSRVAEAPMVPHAR